MNSLKPIRVMVVDDSAFMRKIIGDLLSQDSEIQVVGNARDGLEALEKIESAVPDVITLDVEMPRMDGLTALKEILKRRPVPVVMVSSLTQEGAETTIRALAQGAFDFVAKPSGAISLDMGRVAQELVKKVKLAARMGVRRITLPPPPMPKTKAKRVQGMGGRLVDRLVVIGCSTGGPGALHHVVPALSEDLAAGVLIVQHMPAGFTRSLAQRLDELSSVRVREAAEGDSIERGKALVAPGGFHMTLREDLSIALNQDPPVHGVRPAVDKTFESVVPLFRSRCLGVIMTGMGYDGGKGALVLKKAGGRVIAQNESTCVVYGMPKVVVEMGAADQVLPLDAIPAAIEEWVQAR